jgi:hypothetical protein
LGVPSAASVAFSSTAWKSRTEVKVAFQSACSMLLLSSKDFISVVSCDLSWKAAMNAHMSLISSLRWSARQSAKRQPRS